MADKDKLTTSDIADQTKTGSQGGNGDARRDTTATDPNDMSVDDARAQLDRSASAKSAPPNQSDATVDETHDNEPVFNPPLRPADATRTDTARADTTRPDAARADSDGADTALLEDSEAQDLRRRWTDIQSTFVDRPKDSVSQADELVAETIKRLAEGFADERDNLETVWSKGGDVSTEDLRVALQRYRSFFERLLNA